MGQKLVFRPNKSLKDITNCLLVGYLILICIIRWEESKEYLKAESIVDGVPWVWINTTDGPLRQNQQTWSKNT